MQTQLCEGGLERVTVEYSGEVASLSIAPLTIAVLKGLLSPIMEAPVNYVNAPIVAKERGIEVKEVKSSDAGDFTSLIRVRVEAAKKSYQVAGTLFHKKDPRIVEIDQFNVEVVPEGHMLLIHNIDRPGVIGMVGKVLGDNQINIVRMQCALEKRGGNALLIIGSDAVFPDTVLETITVQQRHSFSQSRGSVLTRIIHEHVCCNRRSAAATVSAPPEPSPFFARRTRPVIPTSVSTGSRSVMAMISSSEAPPRSRFRRISLRQQILPSRRQFTSNGGATMRSFFPRSSISTSWLRDLSRN